MNIEIFRPVSFCVIGKRTNQEDAIRPLAGTATEKDRLFILCDGMGGCDDGEIASNTVADAFVRYFNVNMSPDTIFTSRDFDKALSFVYDELDKKDNGKKLKKMGTTLCFLYFHQGGAYAAHIGDSRIYQIRPSQKRVVYKSHDHSRIMDMIALGEITPERAKEFPYKNVLTRVMQPQAMRDKAEEYELTDIRPDDYFIICSDGILENIDDRDLVALVSDNSLTDCQKCDKLKELTSNNKDNHSVQIIHTKCVKGFSKNINIDHQEKVSDFKPKILPTKRKKKSATKRILLFLIVILIALIVLKSLM